MSAQDQLGSWRLLPDLFRHLSPERRRQFVLVLILMVAGAIAELATIGAVLPFLSLLSDPTRLENFPWLVRLFETLGADSPQDRLIVAAGFFIFVALAAALVRLILVRSTQRFAFDLGHELSVEIERRILLQPYSYHLDLNSSTLIAIHDKVGSLVSTVVLPLMQAGTAIFIALFIIAALLYVDVSTALVAAVAFSAIYLLVSRLTRRRLAENSAAIATGYDERVLVVQESLGAIRDVIIDRSQAAYLEAFRRPDRRMNVATANTLFIAAAPRFVIEALGMVLIALLAILISARGGGLAGALPILGAVALGALRLLPLLQAVYHGWTTAAGHWSLVGQVLNFVRLPLPQADVPEQAHDPLPLRQQIRLEEVSFKYPTRSGRAIDRVSVEIPAGSTIALIGQTGSGKSTLADLLMGLLTPTEGRITVDGTEVTALNRWRWWQNISHVPQAVFLADSTIARNIAFGVPPEGIDFDRVIDAGRQAQLHGFVASLPEGYETRVGEKGIRLSGGQRQRVGIARALYKQASVLILDEATSALDEETEAAVMTALHRLAERGTTMILIAHRRSTIEYCDLFARLDGGRLVEFGRVQELLPFSASR